MMENVVAHFVAHHRLNLFRRAAIQKIVVEDNALRTQKSADVCAHPRGLPGRIDLVNFRYWDPVSSRQAQDWIFNLRILKFLERVEQWRNVDRSNQKGECEKDNANARAPHPPVFSQASDE